MKDKITTYLKENEVSFDIDRNDIKVNPAYLLKGMYVDLYLTISKEKVVSDLLVNNVRIIGLYDSNGNEIKDYDEEAILDMITISLDESYVSYLNKAIKVGELSVVLKADAYNDEESILNTDSVIFKYLQ